MSESWVERDDSYYEVRELKQTKLAKRSGVETMPMKHKKFIAKLVSKKD